MSIILISGVPCCLKTTFGDWLRDNRGFLHVDIESEEFRSGPLLPHWRRTVPGRVQEFLSVISRNNSRVVLTWGYPEVCADWIPSFRTAGVRCLWFFGEVDLALTNWIGREGREPTGCAREHFDFLKRKHAEIRASYGAESVETLRPNGVYLKLPEIARKLRIPPAQ